MATLEVRTRTGKRLAAFTDSTLCTHFGLSGPSALDISRYYLAAAAEQEGAALVVNWLPNVTPEAFDEGLRTLGRGTVLRLLTAHLPERLARALCAEADVPPGTPGDQLTREARRRLMRVATQLMLPVTGSRGFNFAEVTAGGVPLDQMYLDTMESRITPGLHFCGEICDVDGQIGGYNFQWAWSSGYVAGTAAARMLV